MTYFCVFQLACVCSCRRSLLLSPWELNCWFSLGPPEAQKIRYGKQRGDNTGAPFKMKAKQLTYVQIQLHTLGSPQPQGLLLITQITSAQNATQMRLIQKLKQPVDSIILWGLNSNPGIPSMVTRYYRRHRWDRGDREDSSVDTTGVMSCVEPSSDAYSSEKGSKLNHL